MTETVWPAPHVQPLTDLPHSGFVIHLRTDQLSPQSLVAPTDPGGDTMTIEGIVLGGTTDLPLTSVNSVRPSDA